MNYEPGLLPEEPVSYKEQIKTLQCSNDDCELFEAEVGSSVEVEYWADGQATFNWECTNCGKKYDEEYNSRDEIDWDSYYEGGL